MGFTRVEGLEFRCSAVEHGSRTSRKGTRSVAESCRALFRALSTFTGPFVDRYNRMSRVRYLRRCRDGKGEIVEGPALTAFHGGELMKLRGLVLRVRSGDMRFSQRHNT